MSPRWETEGRDHPKRWGLSRQAGSRPSGRIPSYCNELFGTDIGVKGMAQWPFSRGKMGHRAGVGGRQLPPLFPHALFPTAARAASSWTRRRNRKTAGPSFRSRACCVRPASRARGAVPGPGAGLSAAHRSGHHHLSDGAAAQTTPMRTFCSALLPMRSSPGSSPAVRACSRRMTRHCCSASSICFPTGIWRGTWVWRSRRSSARNWSACSP